jgi:hypothetical protein
MTVDDLAKELVLGALLTRLAASGGYDLLDHWQQGEFHHDVILAALGDHGLPGPIVVVATNCNGGVKEVLSLASVPNRWALWHHRCPENPEFRSGGEPLVVLDRAVTLHHFDPCELLVADARSELLPEYRERMRGGGWCKRS